MKNFEILLNGETTGEIVVNAESEKSAIQLYEYWNQEDGIITAVELMGITMPPVFDSCLFPLSAFPNATRINTPSFNPQLN